LTAAKVAGRSVEMFKVLGWVFGILFLIVLAIVVGVFDLIF